MKLDLFYTTSQVSSSDFVTKILRKYFAIKNPVYYRNENGKPYLADNSLYFSLSHSGGITAAAVCEREVGLDIQAETGRKCPSVLSRLTEAEKKENFFYLWTAKEAYVKLRGSTLAADLPSLEYKDAALYHNKKKVPYRFLRYRVGDVLFCVCVSHAEEMTVREI